MAYVRSAGRRSLRRFIADHNPFYLLSAVLMLLGCLLLSNTMTWSPIALRKLLILIATLNVYELLLVGLGLYLIVKRNIARDGLMLLALEALFIVDVGFLNSELYQESLPVGLAVNLGLLALVTVKLVVIFGALGLPIVSSRFGVLLASMAALALQPAWLKFISQSHDGRVPELALYGQWWIAGALMAAYALATRFARPTPHPAARAQWRGVYHLFALLALVSIIAHLGTSHWVWRCTYNGPELSPVLLGLVLILQAVPDSNFATRRDLNVLCVILCGIALPPAGGDGSALHVVLFGQDISPLKITAVAVYLTIGYCLFLRYFRRYMVLGLIAAAVYAFGPSLATISSWSQQMQDWIRTAFRKYAPQSQAAWGFIALAGAFLTLGIGAIISLSRRPSLEEPPSPTDAP
ncbi:MAG: hypothetical protein ACTHLZ_00065 [Tepidisphaeraceae bacterium]